MSSGNNNGNLGRFIQDQIGSLRDDLRDAVSDLRDDNKEFKVDLRSIRDDVDEIKTELGGQAGVRERLTALEVQMSQALGKPSIVPKKPSKITKEHTAMVVGGGAGLTGIIYMAIELINNLVIKK